MNIEIVSGDRLTDEQTAAWSRLGQADPALVSPFFRPEFTQAVAAVRKDVEVAVLNEGHQTVGFFPYQRDRRNIARPVGGMFSDFQGVILKSGVAVNPKDLLRACGLSAWRFDHVLASQEITRAYHWVTTESPYIDLSGGFQAYCGQRRGAGSIAIKRIMQKVRKIEREVGPLDLQPHTADRQVLNVLKVLLRWKMAQCGRKRSWYCLRRGWSMPFLEHVLTSQTAKFSGMLSVLRAGGRIAAIVFGIRSHGWLHLLIPAYEPLFAQYSPGLILLVKLAEAAPQLGIARIDLGKGEDRYKSSLAGGATLVAEGSVDLRPGAGMLRRQGFRLRELVRASSIGGPAQTFVRRLRHLRSALPGECHKCLELADDPTGPEPEHASSPVLTSRQSGVTSGIQPSPVSTTDR